MKLTSLEIAYIAGGFGILGSLIGSLTNHFLSKDIARRNEFKTASDKLKDAFLDELIKFKRAGPIEIEGTTIYKVLTRAYGKHCAAVYRFNSSITGQELINFNSAWHQYQYPDNNTDNGTFVTTLRKMRLGT